MIDIYKERIRPLFEKSGLMNKDLEARIGIPEKKISDWNAERLKSYDKYIPQIASYFRVSTDYLLGNTDDPSPAGQKEKAAPIVEDGLSKTKYGQLAPENQKLVDSLIEKLLKSQSGD